MAISINISQGDLAPKNEYSLLPAGTYSTTIFDIETLEVKNGENAGKPQFKIQLRVSEGEFENRRLFTYVPLYTGKAFWKTQAFFEALGYDMKDGKFTVPPTNDLMGKAIGAKVKIAQGLEGEENNVGGFAKVENTPDALLKSMGAKKVAKDSEEDTW
jgi:hypothetical protein